MATVACVPPDGGASGFLGECQAAATSLVLAQGRSLPLRDKAYEQRLEKTFKELNPEVERSRKQLGDARTAAGQARIASGIARDYAKAARSLKSATNNPAAEGTNAVVVALLARTANSYARLAGEARAGSRGSYDKARRAVDKSEAALRKLSGD